MSEATAHRPAGRSGRVSPAAASGAEREARDPSPGLRSARCSVSATTWILLFAVGSSQSGRTSIRYRVRSCHRRTMCMSPSYGFQPVWIIPRSCDSTPSDSGGADTTCLIRSTNAFGGHIDGSRRDRVEPRVRRDRGRGFGAADDDQRHAAEQERGLGESVHAREYTAARHVGKRCHRRPSSPPTSRLGVLAFVRRPYAHFARQQARMAASSFWKSIGLVRWAVKPGLPAPADVLLHAVAASGRSPGPAAAAASELAASGPGRCRRAGRCR